MARKLGLQLKGATKHLEEQVEAMQRVQLENLKMRKQLQSKGREWQEVEQRYQENLTTINKLETKLEHVKKEVEEMRVKTEGLERDRIALQQQLDQETLSHSDALACAQQKHQEMKEKLKSKNDALQFKTDELGQSRQRELSLANELKLANKKETEGRLELDKIRKTLVNQDENHVREMSAKQEENIGLVSRLEVAKQTISQLQEKVEMIIIREQESLLARLAR
jgi:chromosome segregation ATPase